jgi:hypothetical protein
MITKEQLIEEIEDTQSLELVHQLIQQIKQQQKTNKTSLMSQLRNMPKITAPSDFAQNSDAYLNGENFCRLG